LNAAGLNLTKLDHVRTSAVPKSMRKRDWMRPLWLLGMFLYILSQLMGSTLALEYMRAEYVAPLGSTSLVFNFLFARFLVGTPITSTDLYGAVTIALGVVGIVGFGSINSGLAEETDLKNLSRLWRRGSWLGFFFFMTAALFLLIVCTDKLDRLLVARSEIIPSTLPVPESQNKTPSVFAKAVGYWTAASVKLGEYIEWWTAAKDDKVIAWTLGIGWACSGGGLAGMCLVFAKATVKLLSGTLSHQNRGNQIGIASIFTVIFLAVTAVAQIVCLNKGLKVYDSTLVVPVFYGVYTASGWLDSLIFNDEVDAYQSWTLFLIFASIMVLISGVVLLTYKKPETSQGPQSSKNIPNEALRMRRRNHRKKAPRRVVTDEEQGLGGSDNEDEDEDEDEGEENVLWAVGDESDGENTLDNGQDGDVDHYQNPIKLKHKGIGFN
ncbi:hypothetical protein FISHEDRAFT_25614, partial [Fistulina hepatica ATCC 64428]